MQTKNLFFTLAKIAARAAFRGTPIVGDVVTGIEAIQDLSEVVGASEEDPQVQRIKKFIRGWKRLIEARRKVE